MSLYKDASLVMLPSAYKDGKLYSIRPTDGSGDFTFSRGSNLAATRVDVNGLIEKGRENHLLHSNDFSNVAWDKNIVTLAGNQSDKDGGTDAWKITANSTGLFRRLQQTTNKNEVVASSIYAKAGTADHIYLVHSSGSYSSGGYQFFDLTNGTLGASSFIKVIDASIESVGNGWYRCTLISEPDAQGQCYFGLSDGDVDTTITSGNYIYIQDAQLEAGLVATDYIETGASTAQAGILEDMPRLDYSGGASCPALLLEPQRTNLVEQSEYFEGWTNKLDVALDFGYLAPDGTNSAYKVTKTNTNAHIADNFGGIIVSGVHKSIWAKTTSGTGKVNLLNHNNDTNALFTITNEWQRFDIAHANANFFYAVDFRGAGTTLTEVILWGAQAETGSYPTSYIPTYGSSVTRSRDQADNQSLNPVLGNGNISVMYDFVYDVVGREGSGQIFLLYSNNNSLGIKGTQSTDRRLQLFSYGDFTGTIGFNEDVPYQTRHKVVFRVTGEVVELFYNGVKQSATISGAALGGVYNWSRIKLDPTNAFLAGLNQLAVFPTALTDSECIALTTL